jgi:glycosyltransferase 2 family protein
MTTSKLLRLGLGGALAALFAWLIVRQVRLDELERAFASADMRWVFVALIAFAVGYSCRIERWRLMLARDNPRLTWWDCAGPFMGSFAANNVLPFRAGDVLRSFAFNKRLGTTSGVVIATLIAERLLDLLLVLALLAAALIFASTRIAGLAGAGSTVPIAGAGAVLLALFYPDLFKPFALWMGRIASRFWPKLGQKIVDEIEKSLITIHHLTRGNTMVRLVTWSLLAWVAEGCVYWASALALPSISVPIAAWVALPVGSLATLIPSTPGYVGTFDYFTIRAMAELGNATVATAAYALLVHVVLWLPPTIVGGLYLLIRR